MSCCFSPHILTRAERDAIARLREKRAAGSAPVAAAHRAPHYSHPDPVVTFYHKIPAPKPLPRKPRPQRPARTANIHPVANRKPATKTAHQQKKLIRQAAKRARVEKGDVSTPEETPPVKPAAIKTPPVKVLVEKVRNVNMFQSRTEGTTEPSTQPPSDEKENSVNRFMAATKKRFENVKHRFANQSPVGERFVLQQSPPADPSESNNDQYFQDLMKSET